MSDMKQKYVALKKEVSDLRKQLTAERDANQTLEAKLNDAKLQIKFVFQLLTGEHGKVRSRESFLMDQKLEEGESICDHHENRHGTSRQTVKAESKSNKVSVEDDQFALGMASVSVEEVLVKDEVAKKKRKSLISCTDDLDAHCTQFVHSNDTKAQHDALTFIFKTFQAGCQNIDVLMHHGVHRTAINLINAPISNTLLHTVLLTLNNLIALCSPAQFARVVNRHDLIPSLVRHVGNQHDGVCEQAIWTIKNLAVDNSALQKKAIEAGAVTSILKVLKKPTIQAVGSICWTTLDTLAREGALSLPDHQAEIKGIMTACVALANSMGSKADKATKKKMMYDALVTLHHICSTSDKHVWSLVYQNQELLVVLVDFVAGNAPAEAQLVACEVLGLIGEGTVDEINQLIKLDVVSVLATHFRNSKYLPLAVSASRCLSNICSGDDDAIAAVKEANLYPQLMRLAVSDRPESDIRMYSAYAVLFSCFGASLAQTQYLVDQNLVPVLCELLNLHNNVQNSEDLAYEALKSLYTLLNKFQHLSDFEYVNDIVVKEHGWARVEQLKQSTNERLRSEARKLDAKSIRATFPKK